MPGVERSTACLVLGRYPAKTIWRLDASGGALRSWTAPEMVACIAPARDGSILAGMETGIFRLRCWATAAWRGAPGRARPRWAKACASTTAAATARAASGAAPCSWTWRPRAIGRAVPLFGRRGLSGPVVSGLLTQNGLAFSPDGRTMYLSDSHPARQQVWAFDYDTD
jgi:sugar lactone lactonase YvrE